MDEMCRFVTGVTDLVKEKYHTSMLHDDMTLSRLMVYAQLIKVTKLGRIVIKLKRSGATYQGKLRSKKRVQTQDGPSAPKGKFEKGGGSQNGKLTCASCGKSNYGECLLGSRSCFCFRKYDHKVRDCPNKAFRGRAGKIFAPNVPKDDAPYKRHFYALWTRGYLSDDDDD